jgi:hypothetical protein
VTAYAAGTQPTPSQDWVQLFVRVGTEVVAHGGFVIANSTRYTKLGYNKSTDYDLVVGPAGTPQADYNDIQSAINAAVDGNRILVMEGTYTISTAGNPGVDASAALAWSNKTLTVEGEGWGTVIVNSGALTRGFGIQSGSASVTAMQGNGSRVLNLRLQNFVQSVRFDGSTFGIRNCRVELWHTSTASYTAPVTTGSGTIENNVVREHAQSTGLTPNYVVMEYNLASAGASRVRKNTDEDITAKLRVGVVASSGRLKLPVYTTANRTGASGLEEGEIFWDTTTQTIEVRGASSFYSHAPVPYGAIIAVGGAFAGTGNTSPVTTILPSSHYALCNGTTLITAPAHTSFTSKYVPDLTNNRFLSGYSSFGGNGGSNTHTHTMSHTHTIASHRHEMSHSHAFAHTHTIAASELKHDHTMPHVHQWSYIDTSGSNNLVYVRNGINLGILEWSGGLNIGSPAAIGGTGGLTGLVAAASGYYTGTAIAGTPGSAFEPTTGWGHDYAADTAGPNGGDYTAGATSGFVGYNTTALTTGGASTATTTVADSFVPLYLNVVYYMRVY